MLLTKDEIQTITLNAKFVHKYADQVFFANELNNAPARLGDQPFLNFFVRYHHRDAPERYSWSRVRRVVPIEEAIAAAQRSGLAPPSATATAEWRGKTVWVCLAVEPVNPTSSAALTSSLTQTAQGEEAQRDAPPQPPLVEEEFVMLQQLSNTVPENDEVLAFCVASANHRPGEKYVDGILGDAPAAPAVLADPAATDSEANINTTTATAETTTVVDADGKVVESTPAAPAAAPPASLNPRLFIPTARQIELLRQYKKQHFTHHQWSEEEIEQSKLLRQRYSGIGVAAAPVRTVAFVHEHRVVERRQQQQQQQRSASATQPASPVANLLEETEISQDPLSGFTQTQSASQSQSQMSQQQIPTSPAAIAALLNEAPLSPFLPRRMLRQQQQHQQQLGARSSPTAALNSTSATPTAFANRVPSDDSLAASQTPPLTPDGTKGATTTPNVESLAALSQHMSQLQAAEDSFFKYISDEKRSHYLNRLANITLRNSETNAQNRRRGIANERRLERKGNLLESRGLWITDDKERSKQADDYVKASTSSSGEAKKKDDRAAAAAKAAAAGGAAGELSDPAKNAEEVFVEKFKAYHDAQQISFADCEDDLLSGTDADVEKIVQAATQGQPNGEAGSRGGENSTEGASSPARTNRRAVRRLLPNRLNTEEATPSTVQAQLVHRSTLRMAKRAREE